MGEKLQALLVGVLFGGGIVALGLAWVWAVFRGGPSEFKE